MINIELSNEEKILLKEVDDNNIVRIPSRMSENQTEEQRKKLPILKSLVYKDLISFSVDFKNKDTVFVSRKRTAKF